MNKEKNNSAMEFIAHTAGNECMIQHPRGRGISNGTFPGASVVAYIWEVVLKNWTSYVLSQS